jgi:hypothetical protein
LAIDLCVLLAFRGEVRLFFNNQEEGCRSAFRRGTDKGCDCIVRPFRARQSGMVGTDAIPCLPTSLIAPASSAAPAVAWCARL